MNEDDKKISEFNESMLQIQRIHNKILEIASAREKGDFPTVKWKLDSWELELSYDAKKLDEERSTNYCQQLKNINDQIRECKNIVNLYYALKEKDRILREVQQESGKGSKYKSMDEDRIE